MTSMKVRKFTKGLMVGFGLAAVAVCLAACGGPKSQSRYAELSGVTMANPQAPASNAIAPVQAPVAQPVSNVQPVPMPLAPLGAGSQAGERDRIHVGDTLSVIFTDLPNAAQPQLVVEDRVREDGTIVLIQNLSFKAAGKTRHELETEIRTNYVPQYFRTMTVQVDQKGQTQFYYVNGEVKQPNRQVYIGRLTLTGAIASANGFTDFARRGAIDLVHADGRKQTVNFFKIIKDPSLDPEIFPGDKIYVARKKPWQP